jgi:serine/threonine protein kinase/tetratricopeptide (TPR) repeat protein
VQKNPKAAQRVSRLTARDVPAARRKGIAEYPELPAIRRVTRLYMTSATSESSLKADSTRELIAGWNVGGDHAADDTAITCATVSAASLPAAAPFSWGRLGADAPCRQAPMSQGRAISGSVELVADFALTASTASVGSTRAHGPGPGGHGETSPAGNEPKQMKESDAMGPRPAVGLPRPGDELAGFRIVLELGRGAFARVYLAEEINLGRRLVAIKVSQPDGDEPQILARLQHTHIVPVHSVCDDPSTGLRVLCMPFFGAANLAAVLEAAGGPAPLAHDGRSLVRALDEVSRSLSCRSSRLEASARSRRARPTRLDHAELPTPHTLSSSARGAVAATSRFRSLFGRLVGPKAAPPVVTEDHDKVQPARQFLRRASAIQAAVWIVARLADGLDHAHSRGLLHRDLKPSNVLLADDGTPMLLDFNLAVDQLPSPADGEIRRALVGGTLPYMSPEHLDAFNPRGSTSPEAVDERSDIYAMGLILFEMLAGRHPFPETAPGIPLLDAIELLIAARRAPPSLRAICPEIPWSLDALVAKCLSLDPGSRYQRARDLAEDLRRFLDHLPMKHCPEPSMRERMAKFAWRHPGLCGSTSIALISIVLIGALGATIAVGYDQLQHLFARVRIRSFDRDYTEVQFLLNTAGCSDERLKRGIALSRRTLSELGFGPGGPARLGGWQKRLTPEEEQRFREQVAELIMLDARAGVLLASKTGNEADRQRAIEGALGRLDRALQLSAQAPAAIDLERARYHAALGQADLAAELRKRAAAHHPSSCHDLTMLATTLLAGGDPAGAEQASRRALERDVTSFWAWFVLGHCYFAQGRFLEAAGAFNACCARGPTFAWSHFNRALALARAGRLLDAVDAYDRALALEPKFPEALVDRAMVELELDRLDRAQADLVRAIELGSTDVVVFAALGDAWARLGRRNEAEQFFARLLASDPGNLVVRVARGITRIRTDPPGAKADFTQVLNQEPGHAHAHYGLALIERATDLKGALAHLDRALQSDPNLIDAVQARALVRARLGERAALDDVDRLVASATSLRLYNAACAVAILSETLRDPRLLAHAAELLERAFRAGFPPADALQDPDLKPLRESPKFRQLFAPKERR